MSQADVAAVHRDEPAEQNAVAQRLGARGVLVREAERIALHDGRLEKARAPGTDEGMQPDRFRSRALAEQRHVVPIAAEIGDVPLHPLERPDLVAETEVVVAVVGEEAEGAQAVVERHHDRLAGGREIGAVVQVPGARSCRGDGSSSRALVERSTVNEDHHRQLHVYSRAAGHPDVEIQAIFALAGSQRLTAARARVARGGGSSGGDGGLRALASIRGRDQRSGALEERRVLPAQRTDGRHGVRNAEIGVHSEFPRSSDGSGRAHAADRATRRRNRFGGARRFLGPGGECSTSHQSEEQ